MKASRRSLRSQARTREREENMAPLDDRYRQRFTQSAQAYEEAKHKRLGTDADRPHRIKYRRMERG